MRNKFLTVQSDSGVVQQQEMTRFSAWQAFCLACRVWILDIMFPLARKGVEITTVVYFWYSDHYYWGMLTTGALLLPGILEVLQPITKRNFRVDRDNTP